MGENWTFYAENLTVGYDGKTVIADVNFSVGAGERILLCGANGLGKSTLLRTLALLQPPVSGKCSFSASSEKRRTVLIPARIPKVQGFSVEQFVAASCYLETDWLGRIPARLKNQIKTAVENVGIPELLHRDISTLSDGEFQKAAIATALVQKSDVVLLDEPTAFLDVDTARQCFPQSIPCLRKSRSFSPHTTSTRPHGIVTASSESYGTPERPNSLTRARMHLWQCAEPSFRSASGALLPCCKEHHATSGL